MEAVGRLVNVTQNLLTKKVNITFELEGSAHVEDIEDAEKLNIKAARYRVKRSLNANALLWKCLGDIASYLNADKWDIYLQMLKRYGKYTYICVKEKVVDAVKEQWRECEVIGEVTINGQKAVQLLCYFGSSTYDTKEMSNLLNGVISEMAEMGIPLPADEQTAAALERWEEEWQNR